MSYLKLFLVQYISLISVYSSGKHIYKYKIFHNYEVLEYFLYILMRRISIITLPSTIPVEEKIFLVLVSV